MNFDYNENEKYHSVSEYRAYARESLVFNVTEDILIAMEDLRVSKKDLARKLGKSPSFVTQMLSGARNMTLGSLSDICFALNLIPKVQISRETKKWSVDEISIDKPEVSSVAPQKKIFEISDHPNWKNAA